MMRFLFFYLFSALLFLASSAYSASAYKVILSQNGKRIGFFVLYKDINDEVINNVNGILAKLIKENGDFVVEDYQEMEEFMLWEQINPIMQYGAQDYGLDAALGLLVYLKKEDNDNLIYIEQYLLGFKQEGIVKPYLLLRKDIINLF